MWSGPRTLSTALMRSFGSRADTVVVDEPLYAFYLQRTGLEHPGRTEILATQATDWRSVVAGLTTAPLPTGTRVHYQKHMTHHLLDEVDRSCLAGLRHAHLIREPRSLVASYARVRAEPTLADLGLVQQVELYERFGGPVLDAADLRRDPEGALRALCAALDLGWDPAMLSWAAGPRPTDGVWARYWYASVEASTGFRPPGHDAAAGGAEAATEPLPPPLARLVEVCQPLFERLRTARLTIHTPVEG
ncbi:HAD family hydrolase [Acidimicrobiaceae bacterium USS-CC1]|uniref:HAD family hydrolase n=1 Tax=Acidiferrimicrobium australe TaxID=2664430 RepID=A0ABW9QVL5_9ACTN|nr:HAD family hydrolase [Acidiferrimicrobium australe]